MRAPARSIVFRRKSPAWFPEFDRDGFYICGDQAQKQSSSFGYEPRLRATTRISGTRWEKSAIRDTVSAIPAEVKEKMFTPVFTTKRPVKGTGPLGFDKPRHHRETQGGTSMSRPSPGNFTEIHHRFAANEQAWHYQSEVKR